MYDLIKQVDATEIELDDGKRVELHMKVATITPDSNLYASVSQDPALSGLQRELNIDGSFWMNVYLESDEAHAYLQRDDIISVLSQKYKLLHIKHSRPQLKVDGASMGKEFEGNVININVTPISNTDAGFKWPTRIEFAKSCSGYDERGRRISIERHFSLRYVLGGPREPKTERGNEIAEIVKTLCYTCHAPKAGCPCE